MRNKSGNRWNADHTPVSMSFQCHKQISTETKTRIHTCMQNAKASTQSWLTRPPPALPDAKRWTCNETLIHLSSAHKACSSPPPTAPLAASVEQHEAFTKDKRNSWIFMSPTLLETQQNSLRSAPRNPHCATTHKYSMHACWWCCSLSLSLYFSVFLWHPARPRTSKCRNARTYTDLNPPTCFHVYAVWLVSPVVHIFTFPSWKSFVQPSGQFVRHSSASVQRMSRLVFKCVSGFGIFVMNPYLGSCFSFTLLAYQPHTC